MKWTSLNQLREEFLSFFESKGHLRLPTFPLVPIDDKSLLLINSGMAPMKKYFTGEETPPAPRVATCQKCIRTLDIDRVGKTARHGTYFEMLGNFSFGDYFKEDAIIWAWEFLTGKLGIPADLLYPSIYEEDDETLKIWTDKIGVNTDKITQLGKADNFWEHGTGPCGPCSEIYFDRGKEQGCGNDSCAPSCDCDRFMEIWNNVFTQFYSDGEGNYTELAQKNIDTGMGLERLACIMQNVDNLFEVDTVRKILDAVCNIAGIKYGKNAEKDVSVRVITDHIRSATFLICDGVMPSNEGKGYILRRLLRGAARHGKLLSISRIFLYELCDVVIAENVEAYPELAEKNAYIKRIIKAEEERFESTIDSGLAILDEIMAATNEKNSKTITGADIFRLYDTFGFPIDLTREIASENHLDIDEVGFVALMQEQKQRARAARAENGGWSDTSSTLLNKIPPTEFFGYTDTDGKAKIIAIIDGEKLADEIHEGECTLILDRTVFYGESGGQVGDIGTITTPSATLNVIDTKKSGDIHLHICEVADGGVSVGQTVNLSIDAKRRAAIMRNHSTAHLLQTALRETLGEHVEQAGSYVDEHRLRFDFKHFSALTNQEIKKIEQLVNQYILGGHTVTAINTDIDSAKEMGAIALFGEKYGSDVRVIKMGDVSVELCGGTHLDNTAKAGLFKIISESSVAAGIRRIESTAGLGVLELLLAKDTLINETAKELKANNPQDIAKKSSQLQTELRTLNKRVQSMTDKLSQSVLASLFESAKPVGKLKLITKRLDMEIASARSLCDNIKTNKADTVAVFAILNNGKLNFLACCGKDAVAAGANAGAMLKQISAITGGSGGGRADSAMSGGKDHSRIDDALNAAEDILKDMLK